MTTGEFDRVFTFEVAEMNEQEENAVSLPGFQVPFYLFCTNLGLIYLRWIHAIFRPIRHPLAIRGIPQLLYLAFCAEKLRRDFWLRLTFHLKLVPSITTKSNLAGCPSSSYCRRQHRETSGFYAHVFYRMNNSFVLSEELEEDAVKTLVDVAIEDLFPEPCDKWRTRNQENRTWCKQELVKRKDTVRQEIARGEDSLLRALHEAVVEDVIKLFPYEFMKILTVLWTVYVNHLSYCRSLERDRLSPRARANDGLNTNQEASGRESACGYLIAHHFFSRPYTTLRSRVALP